MWVFFCLLALLILLLFGKLEISLKNKKGREKFFWLTLSFCGVRIYRRLFFLHFKHVVRPEIIEVKKAGFRKIYIATIRKDVKRRDFRFLLRSTDFRKIDLTLWLGTGDAAHTAVLCGALQTAAKSFARALGLAGGQIAVRPDFEKARCHLWLDGILCLSLVNIIGRLIKEMRQRNYASDRTRIKHYHV